jgi:hypothetical protein
LHKARACSIDGKPIMVMLVTSGGGAFKHLPPIRRGGHISTAMFSRPACPLLFDTLGATNR